MQELAWFELSIELGRPSIFTVVGRGSCQRHGPWCGPSEVLQVAHASRFREATANQGGAEDRTARSRQVEEDHEIAAVVVAIAMVVGMVMVMVMAMVMVVVVVVVLVLVVVMAIVVVLVVVVVPSVTMDQRVRHSVSYMYMHPHEDDQQRKSTQASLPHSYQDVYPITP